MAFTEKRIATSYLRASNYYESSLHAIISDSNLHKLLDRLRALCVVKGEPETTREHDLLFIPSSETPSDGHRSDDVLLRLRARMNSDLDYILNGSQESEVVGNWMLLSYGSPEHKSATRSTTIRPVTVVGLAIRTLSDALRFMSVLGYRFHEEFVKSGYIFQFRRRILVTVSQYHKVDTQHKVKSGLSSLHKDPYHIVEIASLQQQGAHTLHSVKMIEEDILQFAAMLKGLVSFEQLDSIVLQNRIPYST